MRTLTAGAIAALATANPAIALLIEMDLSTPLFLNHSRLDLVIGGSTYYGTKGLGQVQAIQESSAELPKLSFQISGVPSTSIALVLTEPVQGKAVRVKLAIFDQTTGANLDSRLCYAGWLDVMAITDSITGATITVTSESATLDLQRPMGLYYTDMDQQMLAPGDLALQFVNDQVEQQIVWPSASFFKK